jgi:tetratricopeptide (TPR) repeat protein
MTVLGGSVRAEACERTARVAAEYHKPASSAIADCDAALEAEMLDKRDRAATYVNRGIILVALERYRDGYSDYLKAVELAPDLPEPYLNRGNVWFMAERYDRAIADYQKSLELRLGPAQIAHTNLGMAYARLGNRAEAEAQFRRAIDLAPEWDLPRKKLELLLAPPAASPKATRP